MDCEKVLRYRDLLLGDAKSGVSKWESAGGTHLSLNTMNSGLPTPSDHIEAIRRFKEALDEE